MKKTHIILVLLLSVFLFACQGSSGLPEGFEEEAVRAQGEEIVALLHDKDTDGLHARSTEMLKSGLGEETMEQVYAIIDEAGAFDSIEDMSIGGVTNKENEEELALAVVKAKYELKTITYTLTFTKQMKLSGLFLK